MIKQERLSAAAAANNNLPPTNGLSKDHNGETNQSDWSLKAADKHRRNKNGDIDNNLTVTRV